jgi:hypothetical protein
MSLNKILLSALVSVLAGTSDLAADPDDDTDDSAHRRIRQALFSLPLRFEENTGHFDAQVKYLARGPGYTVFLTATEAVLAARGNVVRVHLCDANGESAFAGENEVSAPTNYFIGSDASKWISVTNYERVRCRSPYPGIDLVYHGNQRQLEYDFSLAPHASPKQIALRYDGVRALRIDKDGSLVLKLKNAGELRQDKPVAYQNINGERREVACRFAMKGNTRVGFAIGEYDVSQPLVIDPTILSYSTYLGGNITENGRGIAVDAAGNAYIAGSTTSTDFPVLNQYQTDQSNTDVFVTKINTNASGVASLVYSTYLGGSALEDANGLAVDSAGHVFLVGYTDSMDFPLLNQYQGDQPARDAFVTKLDTNTSGVASLLYSTYVGGNANDVGQAIAVGAQGNLIITGATTSTDFPILNQYQSDQPQNDVFVTKLNPNASGAASLLYSTYLGGSSVETGFGVAVDTMGMAYVTGVTSSTDFPTLNPYQTDQGGDDVFVTKINSLLSGPASLVYSTYLGGGGADNGQAIAVDSSGQAYVTGKTGSANFPTLNEYQTNQPLDDAFVTKLNSSGNALLYSTYLGGGGDDGANGIAIDSIGRAYVTGDTDSGNFPTNNGLLPDQPNTDAFVTKINTNSSGAASLSFSTYLGGNGIDHGYAIAVDIVRDIYVTGQTASSDFPKLNEYQTALAGTADAFLTRYSGGPSNETCAGAIPVALNEVVSGTTVGGLNDYQLSGGACFTGFGQSASTASGRDVVYSFTAPAAGNYSFRISNYGGGGDPVLYVASTCPAATGSPVTVTTCLGASNRTGAVGAYTSEEVMCLPLTSGQQVFIFVDEDTFVPGSTFLLEVNECLLESEPNDTPATADPLYFGVEGAINPFTDIDFFSLGASGMNANARVFALVDGRAAPNKDFDLRVTTTTDTLEFDNQDTDLPFGDLSPTIAGAPLTGANSFLRIVTNTPPTGSEPYRIYAVVQPPGAGLGNSSATAESEPNGNIAQADSATNNFFSGSLAGPAPSNDRDYFSFTAEAGDLIFLSLDADPLRNNTPIDAKLALLDANGAILLEVNDGNSNSNTASGAGSLGAITPRSPAESLVYRATETATYYAGVAIGTTSPTAIGAGDYLLSIAKDFRLVSAASRKTHGGTPFDIPLPLSGEPGVECRSGGTYTLVFTFNNDVVSGSATVAGGTFSVGAISLVGNTMTVTINGVADQQKITISLNDVTDRLSRVLPNKLVSMNVLLGDTTGNKTVNATDVSQTKLQSGNAATVTNFRSDVNASGTINATDVSQVKLNSGHGVP